MQKLIPLFFIVLSLSACEGLRLPAVFKVDIAQGNIVTQEMLNQLKKGMTPEQVRYVLGTPQLQDPLQPEQWDYMYRFKPGHGPLIEQKLIVYFDQGIYSRYEGTPLPKNVLLRQEVSELEETSPYK